MNKPYILGITGHRDIHPKAYEEVKKVTINYLDQLMEVHSNLLLLSPLASGADQLLAILALERGITVHAPIPFPIERYCLDFPEGEARNIFLKLTNKVDRIFIPDVAVNQKNETLCYFAVGAFVAQRSQLLFGLWNGEKFPEKTGGTNHIIRCQLEGFPESFRIKTPVFDRKTVWIITPRSTDDFFHPKGSYLTLEQYNSI
ncbi:hypothetical protein JOC75_004401 [Metabacillus crassostreae]|uniref:hypothetical protein n=1 Tax=Metabacillus crassostreae TaxID=929098 RepID=UPI00195F1BBD|nr:hypothetical protein [Metabacillus crassostreae]MBM7606353.1 hypothetical protein [Metabacillus crassostreae]